MYVDPQGLAPFTACRLIALYKSPGIRPIGVGETSRRIIGKAILSALMLDIQESAGSLQLCAGQQAVCEAAVHAMRQLFNDDDLHAVLLVDATNAFNTLNRLAALLNIHSLCPLLAKILTNTYMSDVQLYIDGETLYSCERMTQGDPLAMAMYGIGILPLVNQLNSHSATQVWYVDDATAGSKVDHVYEWWVSLNTNGPSYRYHANPAKTWLIVKEEYLLSAKELFTHAGVNITTDGKRHMGAAVGTRSFVECYVQYKISQWIDNVKRLSDISRTQPHVAYFAFTCGLSCQWSYLSCMISDIADLFTPLDNVMNTHFIPALTGRDSISDVERRLFALPPHLCGLGLTIPSKGTSFEFSSSVMVTAPLVALIIQQIPTYSATTISEQQQEQQRIRR